MKITERRFSFKYPVLHFDTFHLSQLLSPDSSIIDRVYMAIREYPFSFLWEIFNLFKQILQEWSTIYNEK